MLYCLSKLLFYVDATSVSNVLDIIIKKFKLECAVDGNSNTPRL